MNTKKLIIICGLPKSGKTLFRKTLEPLIAGEDTSTEILHLAAGILRTTTAKILEHKELHRPLLVAIGDAIVAENPTGLVDRALERTFYKTPVLAVAGVRRPEELQAVREKYGSVGVDVVSVWINRLHQKNFVIDNTSPCLKEICDMELVVPELTENQKTRSELINGILQKTQVATECGVLLNNSGF